MHTLGHNIHSEATRLGSSDTSFNILTMDGRSGVRYYSNIIAYTHSGIHRTESSDGFVLDSDPPIKGVVYDGPGDVNYLFLLSKSGIPIYVKLLYAWTSTLCIQVSLNIDRSPNVKMLRLWLFKEMEDRIEIENIISAK